MRPSLVFEPEPFRLSLTPEWESEVGRGGPDYIRWLQSSLNKLLGLRLAVDGTMGPATRSAIRSFQRQNGLLADGMVGPVTEQALVRDGAGDPPGLRRLLRLFPSHRQWYPLSPPRFLKDLAELQTVSLTPAIPIMKSSGWSATRKTLTDIYNRLGGLMGAVAAKTQVETASVLAVWKVESGPYPHVVGKAIIRFENHLFHRLWGALNDATYAQYFRHGTYRGQAGKSWENHQYRDDPSQPFREFHGNQEAEYHVLQLAVRLAGEAIALQCISIGGPQILVSNYALIGYRSPRDMFDAFQASERYHVLGFFDFCQQKEKATGGLLQYLRARDFHSFARYYNGPGQVDYYGGKIREAYEEALQLSLADGEIQWEDSPLGRKISSLEELEEGFDIAKTIRLNRCMKEWLGWINYRHEIYTLLGFSRVCPTEAALAEAVRRWQQERGLTADGIVGLKTLNNLLAALGRSTLPAEPARPSWIHWDPSPNFSRRNGYLIDTIVLHATGGGEVNGAMQRFKNRRNGVSSHFIVLRNGVVLQLVELDQAAWHTSTKSTEIPGMNQRSIGIEIVNPGGRKGTTGVTVCEDDIGSGTRWSCAKSAKITPVRPLPGYYRPRATEKFVSYSEPQYRSVIRLVSYLISCIPTIRLITGHEHLHKWHGKLKRFKNRVDPGGQFEWLRIEDALAGIYPGVVVCHKFSRLSAGTNRLNPDWLDQCNNLP